VVPKGVSKFRQTVVGKLEAEKAKRTPLSQEMFGKLVDGFAVLEKQLAYDQEKLEGSSRAQARTALGREFPTFALSMAKRVPRPAIAHVSCTLSQIPSGGFSPVRLQAEVSPRAATSFPLQA
jgi:hypothetical protein